MSLLVSFPSMCVMTLKETDQSQDNTAYVLGQIPLMTLQTKAKMWAGI